MSFMQNTVKTVDVLPNLPAELDIIVLRPSNRVVNNDLRYQRQFRSDFRVRKRHVMAWLCFLHAHHPDYRHITISLDRIDTLPIDSDVSLSFTAVIDDISVSTELSLPIQPITALIRPATDPVQPATDRLPPLNS